MAVASSLPDFTRPDVDLVFIDFDARPDRLNGFRVLSTQQFIELDGPKWFNPAVASHVARRRIAQEMTAAGVAPFSIVASTASLLDESELGVGCILSPYSLVTVNARIGSYFHANNHSHVSHDCRIGDFVTFAPGVRCNGNVHIEDDVYIGSNAVIRQGTEQRPMLIGKGAVVGAGAVVLNSVAAGATVVGNPARVIRSV